MFIYILEFTWFVKPKNANPVEIIKIKTGDPRISIKSLSWIYREFLAGKKFQFGIDSFHKDKCTLEIYSLQDWGESIPFLVETPKKYE